MEADFSRHHNYLTVSLLKRGHFGNVIKAKKRGELPFYALKKIHQPYVQAAQRAILFHSSQPSHPCIVTLLEHYFADNALHLVMEYCDVGTLNSYLCIYSLNKNTLWSFMSDMADGLDHLHQNGIVHGDIKPDNILLSSAGGSHYPRCKISDFSLARFSDTMDSLVGNYSYLIGNRASLCFIAQEVADRIEPTERSDIFSLGVVFYAIHTRESFGEGATWMLYPTVNGRTCFRQATDDEIGLRIQSQIPNVIIARIIHSMVQKEPYFRSNLSEILSSIETRGETIKPKPPPNVTIMGIRGDTLKTRPHYRVTPTREYDENKPESSTPFQNLRRNLSSVFYQPYNGYIDYIVNCSYSSDV